MNKKEVEKKWSNCVLIEHPMVRHKLSLMRDKNTPTAQFRSLLKEISLLMGYEITHDVPTKFKKIETPLEPMNGVFLRGKKPVIVPILRAGLGMSDGLVELVPGARVGHIGLYRDLETKRPQQYFMKTPNLQDRLVIICDPMLATGFSAIKAMDLLIEAGANPYSIRFLSLLAAPEGLDEFFNAYPDVKLYTASVDRCLNEKAYILPGLGDAGDRLFGTK